jgi:hypothetical protein
MAVAALTAVHVIAVISELVAPALQDGEPVARVKANAERARERLRMVASERGCAARMRGHARCNNLDNRNLVMGISRWLARRAAKQVTSERVLEIYANCKYTTLEVFADELDRLIKYRLVEGEEALVAVLRFERDVVREMSLNLLARVDAGEWQLMGEPMPQNKIPLRRIPGSILPGAPWRI